MLCDVMLCDVMQCEASLGLGKQATICKFHTVCTRKIEKGKQIAKFRTFSLFLANNDRARQQLTYRVQCTTRSHLERTCGIHQEIYIVFPHLRAYKYLKSKQNMIHIIHSPYSVIAFIAVGHE
jgi:hypothetical protein